MTTPDRIAVVMPSFNPGPEIEWTLDSLAAQTVPFKLFVVDDGSERKPDYHSLLKRFDYELIELPQNVGASVVRNPALQRALELGFEYIAQIDCGDWAYPTRLEEQVDLLKSRPDASLIGTAVEVLNDDLTFAYDYVPSHNSAEIRRALFYNNVFLDPSMMYRAELLGRIGLYNDKYDAAEGYDLVYRAAQISQLASVPKILLKTVQFESGVSSTRRTAQLLSRLRIQWRYRNLTSIHCWLGMAKTVIVLATPTSWIQRLRPFVNQRRAPRPGSGEATGPFPDAGQ